jgi:outer membrane protein OmpA-like peptidoglycan-associated protein
VVVVGHTDRTGSEEANYRLGQQRAAAVAHYLLDEHRLDPVRVRVTSAGDTQPVADNATAEGRQQNRRVEIRFGVSCGRCQLNRAIYTVPGRRAIIVA